MPRHLDPVARFELMRHAAYRLVRQHGPHVLTRRALAIEMGVDEATIRRAVRGDAPLMTMAAAVVLEHRRRSAPGSTREPGPDRGRRVLAWLLPTTPARVDDEVVWWRLRAAAGTVSPSLTAVDEFRHEVEVTRQGWADPSDVGHRPTGRALTGLDEMAQLLRDDDAARLALVRTSQGDLGFSGTDDGTTSFLVALIDGLTIAVLTGRLAPAAVTGELERWLGELLPTVDRVAG